MPKKAAEIVPQTPKKTLSKAPSQAVISKPAAGVTKAVPSTPRGPAKTSLEKISEQKVPQTPRPTASKPVTERPATTRPTAARPGTARPTGVTATAAKF